MIPGYISREGDAHRTSIFNVNVLGTALKINSEMKRKSGEFTPAEEFKTDSAFSSLCICSKERS
jgi:hypothetical protein